MATGHVLAQRWLHGLTVWSCGVVAELFRALMQRSLPEYLQSPEKCHASAVDICGAARKDRMFFVDHSFSPLKVLMGKAHTNPTSPSKAPSHAQFRL